MTDDDFYPKVIMDQYQAFLKIQNETSLRHFVTMDIVPFAFMLERQWREAFGILASSTEPRYWRCPFAIFIHKHQLEFNQHRLDLFYLLTGIREHANDHISHEDFDKCATNKEIAVRFVDDPLASDNFGRSFFPISQLAVRSGKSPVDIVKSIVEYLEENPGQVSSINTLARFVFEMADMLDRDFVKMYLKVGEWI